MKRLESQIRDAFRGHEGEAPAFDLADARQIAGRTRRRQVLNGVAEASCPRHRGGDRSGAGRLARGRDPSRAAAAGVFGNVDIALPIEYPVGENCRRVVASAGAPCASRSPPI